MPALYSDTYFMGATQLVVGLSSAVQFVPPAGCNGGFFKIQSGSGTLAIIQSFAQSSYIANTAVATGYLVGSGEVIPFTGPARFYLAAAGATMTVSMGLSFTSGISLIA